jgi:hypothetical protein
LAFLGMYSLILSYFQDWGTNSCREEGERMKDIQMS